MATTTFTLANPSRYPSGTTVYVYPGSAVRKSGAYPDGSSVTSAVHGASSAVFSGLTHDTTYWAVGEVAGEFLYTQFRTEPEDDTAIFRREVENYRTGALKVYRDTFGTYDQAAVMSVVSNRSADPTTQVMGTSDPATTSERGSVSVYADNTAKPPLVDSTSTTFTATSVTVTGADLTGVEVGMVVDVGGAEHSGGSPVTGVVQSVSGQTITLSAQWHAEGGALAATPSAGARVRVNRVNKVWGLNVNVRSTTAEGSPLTAVSLAGIELGVETDHDYAADWLDPAATGRHAFGFDSWRNTNYTGRPTAHYAARGGARFGYAASGINHAEGAHFLAHNEWETSATAARAAFLDDDSDAVASLRVHRASATHPVVAHYSAGGDAQPQMTLRPSKLEFGAGGATAVDTVLERDAAARLRLTGSVKATGHGRFEGTGTLAGPAGAEIGTVSGTAYLVAYNRDGAAYVPLDVTGSAVSVKASGTTRIGADGTGLGFFGAAPVAKPTGVAVTAAGIHAALVSLGLIAA